MNEPLDVMNLDKNLKKSYIVFLKGFYTIEEHE